MDTKLYSDICALKACDFCHSEAGVDCFTKTKGERADQPHMNRQHYYYHANADLDMPGAVKDYEDSLHRNEVKSSDSAVNARLIRFLNGDAVAPSAGNQASLTPVQVDSSGRELSILMGSLIVVVFLAMFIDWFKGGQSNSIFGESNRNASSKPAPAICSDERDRRKSYWDDNPTCFHFVAVDSVGNSSTIFTDYVHLPEYGTRNWYEINGYWLGPNGYYYSSEDLYHRYNGSIGKSAVGADGKMRANTQLVEAGTHLGSYLEANIADYESALDQVKRSQANIGQTPGRETYYFLIREWERDRPLTTSSGQKQPWAYN